MAEKQKKTEPRRFRLPSWTPAAGRLIKRHYGWVLAVLGVVLSVVGIYIGSNREEPLAPEQQELLSRVPPKVGWHCYVDDSQEPSELDFENLPQAYARCEPVDPGPEFVGFSLFTIEADQQAYMRGLAGYFERRDVGCGGPYFDHMRWIDSRGRYRGELVCVEGSDYVILVWSDTTSNLVGSARSQPEDREKLLRWWQRTVKFDGDGAPHDAERRLISYLPPGFGECQPDSPVPPGALTTVHCEPGYGISSAGAYLYASHQELNEHLNALVEGHPGLTTDKGCWDSTFSYTSYTSGRNPKDTQGKLLCYVSDGAQWFIWTVDRTRIMAYASRTDENWRKLREAWTNSLYDIRGYG